mmetsp:Transcript_77469/g.224784  ORF Transcript_77469/g.224784 Transcript_77469/m.224784 type:complete len:90 (+) Transcript_77469:327-596(+)
MLSDSERHKALRTLSGHREGDGHARTLLERREGDESQLPGAGGNKSRCSSVSTAGNSDDHSEESSEAAWSEAARRSPGYRTSGGPSAPR